MLIRRKETTARSSVLRGAVVDTQPQKLDRRSFLARSGLAVGGVAAIGGLGVTSVQKAEAGPMKPGVKIERKKNICTHCSVGCTVIAEVQDGVWLGQEPAWESPINRGTHCAKGAAIREIVHGDRRLKYPMKLVDGKWEKISWDTALYRCPRRRPGPVICSSSEKWLLRPSAIQT